ncbi:two-component response regulator ORR21 isoform X2 [Spinacia oleracea]|uniref:Two-component response regulator ORR21 isoform X2 n=1 Tax=Spinacia oleracea TaxID=3562 RepID=A0ABM3RD41_SPIOL|nr:two-component response regulator ORR21-like isoform X2 [Spinacia oleracea]
MNMKGEEAFSSMDVKSFTDICILLVDPDTRSSRNTLEVLLDANYRVVTACQGTDALNTLQNKKRKVDLVLMTTKLPDMCAFEVLDILQMNFRLPVVMVCDTYHGPTMLRFLQNGAMYCLVKPLLPKNVKTLWQHSIIMERELNRDYCESPLLEFTDKEAENHQAEELDKGEGSSTGLSSSFTWTSSLEANLIRIVRDLGVDVATPAELIRRMNVPGLTIDFVIEKLQELEIYPETLELQFNSVTVSPTPAPHPIAGPEMP